MKEWRLKNPDYMKKWRKIHHQQIVEYQRQWIAKQSNYYKQRYQKHAEILRARRREYYKKNAENQRQYTQKYRLLYPEKIKEYQKIYKQSLQGKMATSKSNRNNKALRRCLGFLPLNKPFLNSHAHHIDKERVIFIPKELHKSIPHSVLKNINMDKANQIAFDFLYIFGGEYGQRD